MNLINSKIRAWGHEKRMTEICFNDALSLFAWGKGFSTGWLTRAILDGEISPCGRNKGRGLAALLFSKQALIEYSWKIRRGPREEYYCIPEAAKILELERNFLYFLTQRRILPTKEVRKGGRKNLVINKLTLESFRDTYKLLTIKDAEKLKTNTYRLSRLLRERGITPAIYGAFNGRRYYFYERARLEELNLSALVAEERIKQKLKRKQSKLLTSDQAAQILGVDVQTIGRLVQNGILMPYHNSTDSCISDTGYFFTYYVIDNYMRNPVNSLELISPCIAAVMLGENRKDFYEKWVRPGYAMPRMLKAAKNKSLFHRNDIEELVRLKDRTLSLKEASRRLNIHTSVILQLTKSGKLSPFLHSNTRGHGYYRYWQSDIERLKEERQQRRVRRGGIYRDL